MFSLDSFWSALRWGVKFQIRSWKTPWKFTKKQNEIFIRTGRGCLMKTQRSKISLILTPQCCLHSDVLVFSYYLRINRPSVRVGTSSGPRKSCFMKKQLRVKNVLTLSLYCCIGNYCCPLEIEFKLSRFFNFKYTGLHINF